MFGGLSMMYNDLLKILNRLRDLSFEFCYPLKELYLEDQSSQRERKREFCASYLLRRIKRTKDKIEN